MAVKRNPANLTQRNLNPIKKEIAKLWKALRKLEEKLKKLQ